MENINKAIKQLRKVINNESNWIKKLAEDLVKEAVAPCSWDDIIYEKIKDPTHFRSRRIAMKCDAGYYQDLAEQAYDGVDIEELMNESEQLMKGGETNERSSEGLDNNQ